MTFDKLKEDERTLLTALRKNGRTEAQINSYASIGRMHDAPFADTIMGLCGIKQKRGHNILEKFCNWGWWDYGVSMRTGWLTDKAPKTE